jgi:hypothetical protein
MILIVKNVHQAIIIKKKKYQKMNIKILVLPASITVLSVKNYKAVNSVQML